MRIKKLLINKLSFQLLFSFTLRGLILQKTKCVMAYYDKDYRRRISLGQSGNALVLLIAINLVVFVLLSFVKVIYFLRYEDHEAALSLYDKNVLSWFTLPVDT